MTETDIILALESRWVSRDEIAAMLGTSDRAARSYIEDLNIRLKSHGKCVLSSSTRRGYHIPNPLSEEDVAIANSAVNELKNKAVSLFTRRQAIEDFLKFAETARDTDGETQLSLF